MFFFKGSFQTVHEEAAMVKQRFFYQLFLSLWQAIRLSRTGAGVPRGAQCIVVELIVQLPSAFSYILRLFGRAKLVTDVRKTVQHLGPLRAAP